ncbi:hypothetical protein TanjilG_27878 [Lupinus angustifolius]|uniref:Small EDRK-rich factor-like N-terminal domain-containing protein n=1 Tax=Lupinus angustifolius TaxID=3871 RepID=A0A4P1RIF4_LUPAN|nr:hypothetical protein TanjilG_27878 [Lupinus angustifolius]
MGGGNAQKAKMAREKNLEKQKGASKGSQLDANKKAMTIQRHFCWAKRFCRVFCSSLSILRARARASSKVKCDGNIEPEKRDSDLGFIPVQGVYANIYLHHIRSEVQGAC